MPQGVPASVPDDGLTTRQRRQQPVLAVHTGDGKGKSTAAFGMAMRAWNAGMRVAVFQFVKSAKWKVGEESALLALGRCHTDTGAGGPVEWHKMGQGWSWLRANTEHADDHAATRLHTTHCCWFDWCGSCYHCRRILHETRVGAIP